MDYQKITQKIVYFIGQYLFMPEDNILEQDPLKQGLKLKYSGLLFFMDC